MFGKRAENSSSALKAPPKNEVEAPKPEAAIKPTQEARPNNSRGEPSEEYYETKATIFNALFETIVRSEMCACRSLNKTNSLPKFVMIF